MASELTAENYDKNLGLLAEQNPVAALRIQWMCPSNEIFPCKTEKAEENLYKKKFGITDYYHAQSGALQEAASLLPAQLASADAVCIYGLGLGYVYDALLHWLKSNPQNRVVFLEDDLEVIHAFLHTGRATSLLNDPQATLFYFHDYVQDYDAFCLLNSGLINKRIEFLALPLYATRREGEALALCYHILHDVNLMTSLHNEYLSGQSAFLKNFYNNLFYLPGAYSGSGFFNQFKNVPAIICGAGPSLQKNIERLKGLSERALLFAGGSSLNALNQAGIEPHFGLGVDPNKEQYHRLMTNDTFHLPYFYRPRVSHEAFQLMQGPKLYIPGSNNRLAHWFESELGMPGEVIDEGHNVVNLCTELAYRMGCSPIIYVGMDLAYTETQSYAKGINVHPLWIELSRPYATEEKIGVNRKDIYGNAIKTKWEWIAEATWLGKFAERHKDVPFINATEGGLGFPGVQNLSLADSAERYLTKSYDLQGKIHQIIQENPSEIKQRQLITLANRMRTSLEICLSCCNEILKEKMEALQAGLPQKDFFTTRTILHESQLVQELGYEHFLNLFDQGYQYLQQSSQLKANQRYFEHFERFRFLASILQQHLDIMQQAIQRYIFNPPPQPLPDQITQTEMNEGIYRIENGNLHIDDPEMGLSINQPFHTEEGLHGFSRFYSAEGRLLAESFFLHGKKIGKSRCYYPTGTLYSCTRYLSNQKEGKQEFFYPNGLPYVIMNCKEGRLDGSVEIFSIDNRLLRQIQYKEGARHGTEKLWNSAGLLQMECCYHEGVPVGVAKQWHPNGTLYKEIMIHQFPDDFDLNILASDGKVIQSFNRGVEDYQNIYRETKERVDSLENALQMMVQKIDPALKNNPQADNLAEELADIKEAMRKMQTLKIELAETMEANLKKADVAKQKKMEN
ncbi:MAG: DUF115 domain-containing protein [Parachlamydia sp.]|nr:DUF115 domain-containing protein [Parachlamydia sp.]